MPERIRIAHDLLTGALHRFRAQTRADWVYTQPRKAVHPNPILCIWGNGFCRAYHRPPVFDPRKCSFFRNRLWLRQAPVSPSRRIQNLESLLKTAFGAGHGVWGKYRNARRDWSREVALPSFGRNTRVGEMCQLLGTDIGIAGVIP